jgi:hypothetical protein
VCVPVDVPSLLSFNVRRETSPDSYAASYLNGAPNTNRTCDLPLRRGLLYPLSYRGAPARFYRIGLIGLIHVVSVGRSRHL